MYWEKLKYAQSMMNANVNFPRSWKCVRLEQPDSGGRGSRNAAAMIVNEQRRDPLTSHHQEPEQRRVPVGLSDINQSMPAAVRVKA
jgi:hypothetical protein